MNQNEELVNRVRTILAAEKVAEKPLYDGLGFSVKDRFFCGVRGDQLFVYIGQDRYDEILTHPLARPLEDAGKTVPGWVEIIPIGIKRDVDLAGWIRTGLGSIEESPQNS